MPVCILSWFAQQPLSLIHISLSDHNIRYYQITSSEISISLTIEEKDKLKAVEVLGKAFDL